MSEIQDCARFKITGAVTRSWVANSGKFAKATIEVGGQRRRLIEVRAFREMVEKIRELGTGEVVTIVGEVERNVLKNKAGADVEVDGYKVFANELTATAITRTDDKRAPTPKRETPPDDDKIPF